MVKQYIIKEKWKYKKMFRKKNNEKEIHCPANHRKARLIECKSCTYRTICVAYLEEQKRL